MSKTCATALCNLSIDFPSTLLSTSCSRALFDMILRGHPSQPPRTHHEDDDDAQLLAMTALTNLLSKECWEEDRSSARVKCSAVAVLKISAQNPRREVALFSSRCLAYISLTAPGRHAIIENQVWIRHIYARAG